MRYSAYKRLNSDQRELVQEVCDQRDVDCEITAERDDRILVKMTGESDALAAAWAHIRAGRNERRE